MLDRQEIFDPELSSAVARSPLPGVPTLFPVRGIHRSRQRGESLEFSEHTEYAPGDDLRSLDWKVFAKTDRYYVRQYEDERLSKVLILVDASGSMAYGGSGESSKGSKYNLAATIAVSVASALIRQGDAVGLAVAGPTPFFTPPRGGSSQLEAMIDVLSSVNPSGEADLGEAVAVAAERLPKPSSLVAISDFLDGEGSAVKQFGELRSRGIYPKLVQVLHPDEVTLPFETTTRFADLESPAFLVADPVALRKAYFEEIRRFVKTTSDYAHSAGVPYGFVRDREEALRVVPPLFQRAEVR